MPRVVDCRQSYSYDCGRAIVIAACLTFGRKPVVVTSSRRDGTSPRRVIEALKSAGLTTQAGTMDEVDLRHHLRRGRIVLCLVPVDSDTHWVAVWRVRGGRVSIHDPATGPVDESMGQFLRRWKKAGCYGLAVGLE